MNDSETCRRRHKPLWGVIAIVLMVCGASTALVVRSIDASQAATKRAAEVSADLNVHAARQNGTLENIDQHLQRIDKSLEKVVEAIQVNH